LSPAAALNVTLFLASLLGGGLGGLAVAVLAWIPQLISRNRNSRYALFSGGVIFLAGLGGFLLLPFLAKDDFYQQWTRLTQQKRAEINAGERCAALIMFTVNEKNIAKVPPDPSLKGRIGGLLVLVMVLMGLLGIGGAVAGATTPFCEQCKMYAKSLLSARRKVVEWEGIDYQEFAHRASTGDLAGLESARMTSRIVPSWPCITAKLCSCDCGSLSTIDIVEKHSNSNSRTALSGAITQEQYLAWNAVCDTGRISRDRNKKTRRGAARPHAGFSQYQSGKLVI
jgi:hypothetical protein